MGATAVYQRLSNLGLIAGSDPITVTVYGRDVLAGTVRPPIAARVDIRLDGAVIATVPVELNPYAWQLGDAKERPDWLAWHANRILSSRVTATVTIEPQEVAP